MYIKPLLLDLLLEAAAQPASVYTPPWGSYGGINDRFAFAHPDAAAVYGLRLNEVEARTALKHPMHSEALLKFTLEREGLVWRAANGVLFARVRLDGSVEGQDLDIEGFPKHTLALPKGSAYLMRDAFGLLSIRSHFALPNVTALCY